MAYSQAIRESCKHHYIHMEHTLEEIAKRFDIALRTIKSWKKSEEWDRQKQELLEASENLHGTLMNIAGTVAHDIQQELKEGKSVDPHRLNAPKNLIIAAKAAVDYTSAKKEAEVPEAKKLTGKELMDKVNEALSA